MASTTILLAKKSNVGEELEKHSPQILGLLRKYIFCLSFGSRSHDEIDGQDHQQPAEHQKQGFAEVGIHGYLL